MPAGVGSGSRAGRNVTWNTGCSHRGMEHEAKVARVVEQLRRHDGTRPLSLRKRAVSHFVPKRRDARRSDDKIDLTDLDAILEVDVEGRTCTAEPGATFEAVVRATLPLGLVPTVVPELRTITLGGAVSGCSLESMSFARGGFHDSCRSYEVITTDGEVLRCSRTENPLVFEMMHGSFGTLGILSKLTFELVAARPFVHVEYHRHPSLERYLAEIRGHADAQDVDFMDGILHSPTCHALSLGRFVDRAPYAHRYDWVKVYYRTTATRREDYLRTEDYLFRYDRGVTNPTPKSFLGRLLFGKLLDSARLLRLAEKLPILLNDERPNVTLDVFVPFSRVRAFLDWYTREIGFYPLWCVPYRIGHRYEWASDEFWTGVHDDLFVDLAIYGMPQPVGRNVYKELEDELLRVNGLKTLISYNYYDEETFWRTWSKPRHFEVKRRTDPRGLLRNLYEKTCSPR